MKKYLPVFVMIFLLVSCKESPILVEAGMHSDGNKHTLFTIETVYTVTSSKSGGGISTKSGYTTCYLNAVDVNTGEVIKHRKIGDFRDRIEFIGSLGGKSWFFSHDPAVGLHTRNPETLEIGESIKDIIAKNPVMAAGITDASYQTGMDSSARYLFTTSRDGYNYLVDPVTLIATKTDEHSNKRFYSPDEPATGMGRNEVNDSLEFLFSGSPRSALEVTTKTFNKSSFDFFSHGGKNIPSKSLYYNQVGVKKYTGFDFIEPKFLNNTASPAGKESGRPLLKEGDIYFVISKSMLGNQFNWVVAAININYNDASLKWKMTIDNTEKVNPGDKDLLAASIAGEKLVVVFENVMVALNKATGALIWRKDIRKGSD